MPDEIKNSDCDEDDRRDEELPTTSKEDTINSERDSYNMGDLKCLEFNSADEVRQAMKAVMSGKNFCDDEESVPIVESSIIEIPKRTSHDENAHRDSIVSTTPKVTRKRQGTPPKAGPSRKVRRMNVTDMYLGKLSNVVPFKTKKRKYEYESDSDNFYVFS